MSTTRMLPNAERLIITVNGRTYTGVAGTPVDVNDVDVAMMSANGWESIPPASAETDPDALLKSQNLGDLLNAGTARSNLGLGTAATTAATDYATAAQGNQATTAFNAYNQSTTIIPVSANGSVPWNMANGTILGITLTGNSTVAAPTNIPTAGRASVRVVQDANGGHTLAWNAAYKFAGGTAPTITVTANAEDVIEFECDTTRLLCAGVVQDVK